MLSISTFADTAWCFMSMFDLAIIERVTGGAAVGPVIAGAVAGAGAYTRPLFGSS